MICEEKLVDFIFPYTTVIFCNSKNDSVDFLGSGLLLKHLDRYYLASAAHVIDNFRLKEPLFMNVQEGLLEIEGYICETVTREIFRRKDDQI